MLLNFGGSLVFQTIVTLLSFTFIFWYVKYHWNRRTLYRMARQKPGPLALPFIGAAWCFANKNVLDVAVNLINKYGRITPVWIGQELNFFLSDPEDLEVVMNSPHALNKHVNFKFAHDIMGQGIITANVGRWKRTRKALTPTFNQKILDGFVDSFARHSEILVAKLESKAGQGSFDVFDHISRCTLDLIFETEMGVSIDAQNTEPKLLRWANKALEIALLRMFSKWYANDFIFNLSPLSKVFHESHTKFQAITGAIVEERLQTYRNKLKQKEALSEFTNDDRPKLKTFIELIIELSENEMHFTNEELRNEVDTFFLAGSETTASATSFLLINLGLNPDVQEKVYQEALDELGPDRNVDHRDLGRFPYLERVIKESMRLFPCGPILGRTVTDDIKLKSCVLPKGSYLTLVVFHTQRNPEIFPDPLKFDPDRFLPEEMAKRNSYSWLPFSGGVRNCIGIKYSYMVMKTLIANIIRKYKISTPFKHVEEVVLESQVVLKPSAGHLVSLELRK